MKDIMVSVFCTAYNHERYIACALDSLLMQETEYPFEIIVHDDASTDKTADIIREYESKYPDIIQPIYQTENQYSKGIPIDTILYPKARGKYIAICEGDDFWVSPFKIQKQVSFMEAHPEYSLTVHSAYRAAENGSYSEDNLFRSIHESRDVETEEILRRWMFATNSLIYRKDCRQEKVPYRKDCPNGDFALTTYLAFQGKVYNFDEALSAYRVNSIGSLNWQWKANRHKYIDSRNKFADMLIRIDEYSNHKYHGVLMDHREEIMFQICLMGGDIKNARKYGDFYKKLTVKNRISLYAKHYAPELFQWLKNQKNKRLMSKGR